MKSFKEYFSENDIILYLCKLRAKQASARNKKHTIHLLTKHDAYNYHVNDNKRIQPLDRQMNDELSELLPKRKQWRRIGKAHRYKPVSTHNKPQKINSSDTTVKTLLRTIKYFRDKKPNEPFLKRLDAFIKVIKRTATASSYTITKPEIYPKPKDLKPASKLADDEKNTCRPITQFHLRDRLIISFTNKFLTQLFDKYFERESLAFRAPQREEGRKVIFSHHEAIRRIKDYRDEQESPLWVAECDMKKFYDSVNHKIALKCFNQFIRKAAADYPTLELRNAKRIFRRYLACYCFKTDILPYNTDEEYWVKNKITRGDFEWIADDLKKARYYRPSGFHKARIGVPQGGALSGLIANMMLDYVDKGLRLDDSFLYVRFCDDMILMHPDKAICSEKIKLYQSLLAKLKLVPHKFDPISELQEPATPDTPKLHKISLKPFWKKKSKGPYKWAEVEKNGFPWIGFVGYEVHHKQGVRIRKISLKKELDKQKRVIERLKKAIKNGKRATDNEVKKSAILRLIGMSVGRTELWNHNHVVNEMCWKIGFREIEHSKHTINQIKQLDRSRSKLYYGFIKYLKTNGTKAADVSDKSVSYKVVLYDKPFSYYHQVLQRKQPSLISAS